MSLLDEVKMRYVLSILAMLLSMYAFSFEEYYDSSQDCCDDYVECSSGGCGFDLGVEFLYVKPCVSQEECAFFSNGFEVGGDCNSSTKGSYKSWDFDWEPAFRVFLGTCDIFCGFDIAASYTYLDFKSSKSFQLTEVDDGQLISPIFVTSPLNIENFLDLKTSNRIRYQDFDALLKKPCCINCCHTVVPFFGLAALNIDQKVRASGHGTIDDTKASVKHSSHFSGVGLKMGLTYFYECFSCLDLYSHFSGSIVYGHEKSRLKQFVISEDFGGNGDLCESDYKTKSSSCSFVPGFTLGLGIQYSSCLYNCCDPCGRSLPLSLYLGYEFVEWFNLWQYRRNEEAVSNGITAARRGTIGFHGAVAGLILSF